MATVLMPLSALAQQSNTGATPTPLGRKISGVRAQAVAQPGEDPPMPPGTKLMVPNGFGTPSAGDMPGLVGEPPRDLPPEGEGTEPSHFFRQPEDRFLGPGQPLVQESWNYRPFSVGGFIGFVRGGELVEDWVTQGTGVLGGLRLGWDFDYYWGCETRLAFGSANLADKQRAIDAQTAADDAAGIPAGDPRRLRFDTPRSNGMTFWDISLLYYPWGDARWRPYFSLGFGTASFRFMDRLSIMWDDTVFAMPLGLGVKHRVNDCVVFRLELTDTIAFGGGRPLETTNNLSLTAGAELRFGGHRRAYWPWNPSRHYW